MNFAPQPGQIFRPSFMVPLHSLHWKMNWPENGTPACFFRSRIISAAALKTREIE
jgi:hypothetical protein